MLERRRISDETNNEHDENKNCWSNNPMGTKSAPLPPAVEAKNHQTPGDKNNAPEYRHHYSADKTIT
jgi:hypothetical protein